MVLEIRGVPLDGGGFVTTYLDVTEQRRTQALVAHMAYHDALTNLPNRALLLDRLQHVLARVHRGEVAALLYLDLDGFKPVNDEFGHATGDTVLKAVSDRLRDVVRETDTVARLGGDEFVVLQVGIKNLMDSALLARRVLASLAAPYSIADRTLVIGANIGIAMAPDDGQDSDQLLRNADAALYQCKASGRGKFSFFQSGSAVFAPPRSTSEPNCLQIRRTA